jgi:hypothetical protein
MDQSRGNPGAFEPIDQLGAKVQAQGRPIPRWLLAQNPPGLGRAEDSDTFPPGRAAG